MQRCARSLTCGARGRPIALRDAIHPDDLPRVLVSMSESQSEPPTQKTWRTLRYREARKDASWADIESVYTMRGGYFFGITRDATGGAQAAQRAMRAILLSTSFDLRCSATNVVGASTLLRNRPTVMADAEAAFLADAVRVSCNMLNGLASNVLELRRLERGELKVTHAPFNLHETVRAVLQMCRMAKSTGADLVWANETDAEATLPSLVEGDAVLTALIVQNLAVNALKFCNGSQVDVLVALDEMMEPESAATEKRMHRMLRVDVVDRGMGVPTTDHELIFQKYQRAAPESGGGAGLGLHISRGFARALGGDIDVQSVPGEGSTFTLRVPVRLLDAAEAAALPARDDPLEASGACERDVPAPALAGRVEANLAAGRHRHPDKDPFAECSLQEMLLVMLSEANEIFCYTSPVEEKNCPRFAYVSPSVRKVLGWEPAHLVGKEWESLVHPDDLDKHSTATAYFASAGTDNAMFGMRRMLRADGSYTWMHIEAYQVGETGVYYSIWRDATRAKESQASLREYLLATSHDMRTPVTGIILAAQLLESRPSVQQDGEAAFLVQSIKSCGSLMLSVLSNVLEMRNLDDEEAMSNSLTVVLRPEPFNPRELLAELFSATCIAMGHTSSSSIIAVNLAMAMPESVSADLERMKRILQNLFIALLRNSTDDGRLRVELACPVSPDKGENAELQLDLSDAARTVPVGELELQFTPYYTSNTAYGLFAGLGLCVARAFSQAMGGSLQAEYMEPPGTEPRGMVIRLRVPVRVVDTPPPAAVPSPTPSRKRSSSEDSPRPSDEPLSAAAVAELPHVLLVEDHELNLKLVTKLLVSSGFRVSTAVHGADALAQLRAAATMPDAILTDVQMPVMDGLQFARAFRAWEAQTQPPGTPPVPVVALSANVLDEHVAASYAAGMTSHFAKPLRRDALRELRRLMHCREPPPQASGP